MRTLCASEDHAISGAGACPGAHGATGARGRDDAPTDPRRSKIVSYDEDGDELVRNATTTFVRGCSFGGDRGPSTEV